jgi:hypothetical protein
MRGLETVSYHSSIYNDMISWTFFRVSHTAESAMQEPGGLRRVFLARCASLSFFAGFDAAYCFPSWMVVMIAHGRSATLPACTRILRM